MNSIKNFFFRENKKIKNTHEINLKNLEDEHNRKIEEENKKYYEARSQIAKKNKKKQKIVKQNGRNDEYLRREEEYLRREEEARRRDEEARRRDEEERRRDEEERRRDEEERRRDEEERRRDQGYGYYRNNDDLIIREKEELEKKNQEIKEWKENFDNQYNYSVNSYPQNSYNLNNKYNINLSNQQPYETGQSTCLNDKNIINSQTEKEIFDVNYQKI